MPIWKLGIIPRFYVFDSLRNEVFVNSLRQKGYHSEISADPVQLWIGTFVETSINPKISIEKVTKDNYQDAMFVECSIDEFGGREVRERALELEFQHPSYKHFLLRYNGKPAGIACIFQDGHNARVESVGTLREYRGRGFVKSLL